MRRAWAADVALPGFTLTVSASLISRSAGARVRIIVRARRFKCINPRCGQSTPLEQTPELTVPFARRAPATDRCAGRHSPRARTSPVLLSRFVIIQAFPLVRAPRMS